MTILRMPVRATDNAASHAGAAAIQPRLAKLLLLAFRTFARAGDAGATNEDLYRDNPKIQEHSIRPRVAQLVEMGLIYECGYRMGSHGVAITVWKMTDSGKAEAERRGIETEENKELTATAYQLEGRTTRS